jgi:hypothetical protein
LVKARNSRSKSERHDLVDECQQERAIGAGTDRHPLVGDRRMAGADQLIEMKRRIALELEIAIFKGFGGDPPRCRS